METQKFLVTWVIDIESEPGEIIAPTEAARQAWKLRNSKGSIANVFEVMDKETGETYKVDLAERRITEIKKPFADEVSKIDQQARSYIENILDKKGMYIIVADEDMEEDDNWHDRTAGIAFYNKHGFDQFAHVTEVYKYQDKYFVKGAGYNDERYIYMEIRECDEGGASKIADLIMEQEKQDKQFNKLKKHGNA